MPVSGIGSSLPLSTEHLTVTIRTHFGSWRGSWQACLFQVSVTNWVIDAVGCFCPAFGRVISYRTLQSLSCKNIMTCVWMRCYTLHFQKNTDVLYLTTKQRDQGLSSFSLIVKSSRRLVVAVYRDNRGTNVRMMSGGFRLHRPNCLWYRAHFRSFQNKELGKKKSSWNLFL